jgi:hypothetical protein
MAVAPNPFSQMNLMSHENLPSMKRVECPQCHQSRKFFCYDCFIPMGDPTLVPNMDLPIELDMFNIIPSLFSHAPDYTGLPSYEARVQQFMLVF